LALAQQAGSARAVNVVLLGALARRLAFPREVWEAAVRSTVKPQFAGMNLKAFALGWG
jgi:indolepyruvate ferredoxin oxidoreductase beta subunit